MGYWLAGLTDGEGCFSIARIKTQKAKDRISTWPNCRFEIGLRCDDYAILQEIRDTLGFGSLSLQKYVNPKRVNTNLAVRYSAFRIADCLKVVELFTRFPLRSRKRAVFDVWALAVKEMTKGTPRSDVLMDEYRAEIKRLKIFADPGDLTFLRETNPPTFRHRRDWGTVPQCLCGCGMDTARKANSLGHPHPQNPLYSSFHRSHHRRITAIL